jgi:hypothetical protein
MQLQYKLQYSNGLLPQLERIILIVASLKLRHERQKSNCQDVEKLNQVAK